MDVLEEAEIETPAEEQRSEENQSSQEIDDFINQEKAKNTVKKTKLDWEKFDRFCKNKKSWFQYWRGAGFWAWQAGLQLL